MGRLWSFFTQADRYVGPIYRIIFVSSALIGALGWLVYFLLPHFASAFNWIDAKVADFGPALAAPSVEMRFAISVIVGMAGGISWLWVKFSKVQAVRLRITDEIRRCMASHIRYSDELFILITSKSGLTSDTKMQMISEMSRNHSIFLCSRLAEIFQLATGQPCHASIKTFNSSTALVTTRTRDALMHNQERSSADDYLVSYPVESNTGFARILNDPDVGIYINIFLRWSNLIGSYKNANPSWKKFYCATVVAPISPSENPQTITKDTVVGFICVDSKSGIFPSRYSKAVLSVFVVFIDDMMRKLGEMEAV